MKVLVVGEIQGKVKVLNEAFNLFLEEKYDKIIFTGGLFSGSTENNESMVRCANIMNAMLKSYSDKVICLVGNEDEPYLRQNAERYRCSGFRPELHSQLHPLLSPMKKYYQYAFGIKDYLFTHAGLQYGWLSKHFNTLDKWGDKMNLDVTDATSLWMILDGVARTSDSAIMHEAAVAESDFGSPLWCSMDEMLTKGPYPGLHQICGHTKTDHIYRFNNFEEGKRYKDTSVTYVNVLSKRTEFLTLNIK